MNDMKTLKAVVQGGRLKMDQPTKFPEGTVLKLVLADNPVDLDAPEYRELSQALENSWDEVKAGKLVPASDVIRKLRRRR